MEGRRALIISPKDNVATSLEDIEEGASVAARSGEGLVELKALEKIPFGFKIALADISKGAEVYKYGEVIGRASQPIKKGTLVHIHNLEGMRGRGDLAAAGGKS
ncbi:MAG: UxaA family hydrolase [Dehalococcoidales bacterium]|nr:UxaA family hydrolase [Dehalococcoidales bacterium]